MRNPDYLKLRVIEIFPHTHKEKTLYNSVIFSYNSLFYYIIESSADAKDFKK